MEKGQSVMLDRNTLFELLMREMYPRIKEGTTFEEIKQQYIRDDMAEIPEEDLRWSFEVCHDLYDEPANVAARNANSTDKDNSITKNVLLTVLAHVTPDEYGCASAPNLVGNAVSDLLTDIDFNESRSQEIVDAVETLANALVSAPPRYL